MFGNLGQWAADLLNSFGSLGLVLLLLAENLFPPIPSEVILPLAGFLVSRGDLGIIQALLAATLGSLLGAYILYALGRWGGRPLVLRYGRILRIKEDDLDRAEEWFERYGNAVVFFARMVPGARSVVSVPAGMLYMPLGRFTLLTTAGSALWNALLIGAGWFLGNNWTRVAAVVGQVSNVVVALIAIGTVALTIIWYVRRKRK
ncbi:MAG: DedA family protein [Rubrobacteraceae bacterium]